MTRTRCPASILPRVGQCLQCGSCRDRHDGGLLEREVRRLGRELVLLHGGVLRKGPAGDPEHLVAGGEPGHRWTDTGDRAGDVQARHPALRCTEAESDDAQKVGPPRHHVPGSPVQSGRPDLHEHLVVGEPRSGKPLEAQHLGRPVRVLDDRPHGRGRGGICVSHGGAFEAMEE